jgi:hypothetical protein
MSYCGWGQPRYWTAAVVVATMAVVVAAVIEAVVMKRANTVGATCSTDWS